MIEIKDQMNTTIRLEEIPRRIVSLVPSQTQLLHYLGLDDEVVGVTKFCIKPDVWFREKQRIGGTKNVHIDKVRELLPDLIIGNKEENALEDIQKLHEIAPVWMSDIYSLDDALGMIEAIGELTNRAELSLKLIEEVRYEFDQLRSFVASRGALKAVYFIWHDPFMTAGANTFIDDMLKRCGFINAIEKERYPEANLNEDVECVFLSSEPYPFKEKHLEFYKEKYPKAKVILVDGEMFSWYGSKLKDAPAYFKSLLQQAAFNKE